MTTNAKVAIARAWYEAEVYFGWAIPHEAAPGGFIDEKQAEKQL